MTWKSIRLELARTHDFPEGSPDRQYLVSLPLDDNDLVDADALKAEPARATVRRIWADEPDRHGYIVAAGTGWAFSYAVGEDDDEPIFHLETHPVRAGEYLTLTEQDGEVLPFRVTQCEDAEP
ncbi:hypothetical protein [Sphingobium xenophagum]|uniref:hypothetical protein n=1 Tax=Sphingobium xenophagum TaxID=121428 RepID=UPI001C0C11F0|nr:hypothetical protein [Sphingobium xenophagum]QWT16580.1 hypothetical protein GTV57_20620 [Sphingobium xenophagum]